MLIWAVQCPCHFSEVNAELPRRTEPAILLNLFGWCNCLLKDGGGALEMFTLLCLTHFWEHNMILKPTKCKFFQDEINYLAHHVSKEGMHPSKENPKAVAEFVLPQTVQTYTKIWAFLGLVGHYRQFIKGFACVAQPLHEHLFGEGAHKKSKQVTLMTEDKDTFETLTTACLKAPCWCLLLTSTSHFL